MPQSLSRRGFAKRCAFTGVFLSAGAASSRFTCGIEPFQRPGGSRLLLSLAAYSFRDFFRGTNRSQNKNAAPSREIDLFQFIDFCADHGCAGTELTSYYFPPQFTDEFLLDLKRHAFLRGLAISGTAVGNTFTLPAGDRRDREISSVKKWVDRAQVMGAPHIRVFAGAAQGLSKADARKAAVEGLQECCDYAAGKGIMLGLENHGGIVAQPDDLLEIVRAVHSRWFGVNLDTGNFQTDDPYADLARCAPYAVNVQIKTEIHRRGKPTEPADLARLAQILRDAKYQGYVALEYEASEDPWTAVPRTLAELRKWL